MNAIEVLRKHLDEASRERLTHRHAGRQIEACIAALKIGWLKRLIREIEGE